MLHLGMGFGLVALNFRVQGGLEARNLGSRLLFGALGLSLGGTGSRFEAGVGGW